MKTKITQITLEDRAAEALKTVLGQVSGIKLKEMWQGAPSHGCQAEILAHIDVYGNSHTLACEVKAAGDPSHIKSTLRSMSAHASRSAENATPVLIAPYLSPKAQMLCAENNAAYIDLKGNARLAVGEFFIGTHLLPRRRTAAHVATH